MRVPRRTWALIGAGAVIAVVLLVVIVAVLGGSDPTPPRAEGPLFTDHFSDETAGREADGRGEGNYIDGGYRLEVPVTAEGAFAAGAPTNVASLYPFAPTEIQVDVDARRVSESGQNAGYGVFCRASEGGEAYTFTSGPITS